MEEKQVVPEEIDPVEQTNHIEPSGTQSTKSARHSSTKKIIYAIVVMVVVAAGVFTGLSYYKLHQPAKERDDSLNLSYDEVSNKDKENYKVNNGAKPRLITIPSIGVSARVQEISLLAANSDGSQQMDVPKNVHDVGWYNCEGNAEENTRCAKFISPNGIYNETSAVIDGHSCSGQGCVFDKLGELQNDAEIKIELGNNTSVTYTVDRVETVDLSDVNMEKVMTPTHKDRPGLALITCDGSWSTRDSRGVRSMDKRIIVYASAK